jgi:hypothetical protein
MFLGLQDAIEVHHIAFFFHEHPALPSSKTAVFPSFSSAIAISMLLLLPLERGGLQWNKRLPLLAGEARGCL